VPDARRDPVVRGANAIDRYSLALQLIQVYPIVLAGVAVVLPLKWLRILTAVLGLVIGTTWAVVRERSGESASRRQDDAFVPQTAAEKAPVASNAMATVEPIHGIRVDIWLHPSTPATSHEPVGRRPRHRQTVYRVHRAIPPKPHPHQQSHADEPESEDRPGHPASATRAGAGLRRVL
jgi:hypothetical protein